MNRRFALGAVVAVLGLLLVWMILVSCRQPTPTPTPTIVVSSTVTVVSPLITPTPQQSPVSTPQVQRIPVVGLMNQSFEEPYDGTGVAQYWHSWYLTLPPCHIGDVGCNIPCPSNCNGCPYKDVGCFWTQPEWQQSPGTSTGYFRVNSGYSSQKVFCYGRECEGGVYQVVNQYVRKGDSVTFGLQVMAWQCRDYTACIIGYDPIHGKWKVISDKPYAMNLRVGIDFAGGTDPLAASVHWGTITESFDKFSPIDVTVTAPTDSNKFTVFFLFGVRFEYARANNDVYIDSSWLRVESGLPNKTLIPWAGRP